MAAITTAIATYAVAAAVVGTAAYTASEAHEARKDTQKAQEKMEEEARLAREKLATDEAASIELAAAQVEERKRAIARNKSALSGPLEDDSGQKVKTALGQ